MRSELSEAARLLIETATAQELEPGEQRRARLLQAVRARALLPDVQFDKAAQVTPGATASPVAPLGIWKVAGVAALGAGLGVGVVGVAHMAFDPPSQPPATPLVLVSTPRAHTKTEPRQSNPPPELAPAPAAAALDASLGPSQLGSARERAPAAPSPRAEGSLSHSASSPEAPAASEPTPDSANVIALRAELALLNEMQGALRVGQASRALELVERHQREFPNGQLGTERLATEVFAACQLGDLSRARAAAQRFLKRDTSSPLALRVKGACNF
ncbi:MAG TPA: hypothetical protein VG937_25045 [Polyangiaceae bacterium]|nr:hypothetical protein [Polyangiaceae bacterium]